jgi:zinc transport system ATP-binding protein
MVVDLKNIRMQFARYLALEDINLSIGKSEFVSIAGPNGGGKSTLLKVIIGLIKPTSGSIRIFGKSLDKNLAEKIGYVPQIKNIDRTFPALPIELVITGIKGSWPTFLKKKEVSLAEQALETVGAAYLKNRPISRLSGGELQRVFLARAIVRKPNLLILDEPISGIDRMGEDDMHKILDEYKKNNDVTIIMVTHDWEAAYHHSDKVLLLNRKQYSFDTPEKAFSEQNIRELFGHVGHSHDMIFKVRHD